MVGKLLHFTLKDIAEVCDGWIDNDFDGIVTIDGKRGLGKSTLAYKLGKRLKSLKEAFNPKRDLVYSKEDVLRHLQTRKKGFIFADEMINVGFNRDFYDQKQKEIIKALNMYRDSLNMFVACVPNLFDMDNKFLGLCKLRLNVVRRGVAIVHAPRKTTYNKDPWDVKNNMKIEDRWSKKGTKPKYGQLTTAIGILTFGPLTKKQEEEYKKLKAEKRAKASGENEFEDLNDPQKNFYNNLVDRMLKREITPKIFNEVCQIYGKKHDTVRIRVNNILRDRGVNERYKDLVNSINTIGKKDILGFKKQEDGV